MYEIPDIEYPKIRAQIPIMKKHTITVEKNSIGNIHMHTVVLKPEIVDWFELHGIKIGIYWVDEVILFHGESNAMLFKLTWC
jgi:hypothetical protein